jgi:GT2 family glycosyltransferase
MKLSIVIVNYNSTDHLLRCLVSVYAETIRIPLSVVVVDNASDDSGSLAGLTDRFPGLEIIKNQVNVGFSTACNQGIRQAPAEYYLLLNPDSLILDRAIERSIEFMQGDASIGILGCRVENPDGTLQRACRRSIPRPAVALYRFSGLAALFPGSPRFAAYNYSYQPDDSTHSVEAVSGSFLLFRREVLETGGYLDEAFFLYGEDLDFCLRASRAGWEIVYYPGARITHIKRGSSSRRPKESNYHFYNAMRIFYRKHFAGEASIVERALVLGGIRLMYLGSCVRQRILGVEEVGSRK